jgi:hypothetical protein
MKKILQLFIVISFLLIAGCSKDDNPVNSNNDNSDIPADPTNITCPVTTINNIQPTATISSTQGNASRISINLTGLVNPVNDQPIQLTALGNLFVTEDGIVQGIKVTKVSTGNVLTADIVFSVDNSGSMYEEADSIAASIARFAQALQASGLDARFAIVGYDVNGDVAGGINFTNASAIEAYLNREYMTGTDRTVYFAGSDSAALANKAYNFAPEIWDENGVVAILFADSNYSWRAGAQRIFINFTDEPTQPGGYTQWSTPTLCSLISGEATVHTVWSGGDTATSNYWQDLYYERPWDMSTCTGGTFVEVPYDASGLDLSTLPVTGALSNSYKVEFITSNPNNPHTVIITIKESNADGKREYINITY